MNQESLMTAAQAREYLEKQGYAPTGMQGEKAMLSHTLLLLAHCAPPNILPKGIRVVAAILEREVTVQRADVVITNVMTRLDPILTLMDGVADSAQEASAETR